MPDLVTYQTLTYLSPIRGTRLQFIYYVHYAPQPCRGGARVFAWGGGAVRAKHNMRLMKKVAQFSGGGGGGGGLRHIFFPTSKKFQQNFRK